MQVAARLAAVSGAALMFALALFQLGLAAGRPWGKLAWGGQHEVLPVGFRIASAVAVVIWAGAALVVLRQGGFSLWSPLPIAWIRTTVWILAGYSTLGIALNAISRSAIERTVMTPVCVALAVTCAITALWGTASAT